jgi:IS5 family transposase
MYTAATHPVRLRTKELAQTGNVNIQNYNREAPRLASQISRYAHAKQYKRMRKTLRTLRSRVGRVMRDVELLPDVAAATASVSNDRG